MYSRKYIVEYSIGMVEAMEYYSRIVYDRFTLLFTLVGGVVRVKNLLLFTNSNGFYGEEKTKTVGVFPPVGCHCILEALCESFAVKLF